MSSISILLMFCVITFKLSAQSPMLNCGNGRYESDVFPAVTKTAYIIFGYNTSIDYVTSQVYDHALKLDFYEPAADPAVKRPLIILACSGAFIYGRRTDLDALCTAFSKKGYATATIDYRLIQPGPANTNYSLVYGSQALMADEIVKASSDMKAAIRFFKHDAATVNTYKIDPSKIFIGGFSAGAIIALQTAYTDNTSENPSYIPQYLSNGGLEGNTDLPAPYNLLPAFSSSGIAGVLNIAGGITDTTLVDGNNTPVYSAQGDLDLIVPYEFGGTSFSVLSLFGSHLIQTRANNISLNNQLFTVTNGNHESPVNEPNYSQIISGASAFFGPIVCAASILPVVLTSFTVTNDHCAAVLHWQTAAEQNNSHYDIETSADGIRFIKTGTMPSKKKAGGSNYAYQYQGATGTTYFRLKMIDAEGSYMYSAVQQAKFACGAGVQVFPNPARAQTTVTGLEAGMQVNLINAEGRLLWMQKAVTNTLQIPLATYAYGLYLFKVTDKNGAILTAGRLIKN